MPGDSLPYRRHRPDWRAPGAQPAVMSLQMFDVLVPVPTPATAMLCSCHPGVIATLFFSGTKSNSGNSFYVIDTKRHALVGGPFKSRIRAQHRADELERRVPHG